MRISEFIEATNAARTPEEVFKLFLQALATLGYDRVMYSALALPLQGRRSDPAIARNYPDDWIDHYVAKGYVQTDPVRRTCIVARRPFAWLELEQSQHFPPAHLRIFPEAKSAALHDGVAVPLHGPCGEVMGIGLASSLGNTAPMRHLNKLNVLATQFHTTYQALVSPPLKPMAISLTNREREVLEWCAAGKSNSIIGDILGVSEKTIEFHLANIFTKLQVSTRVAAVVKALHFGLITP
ncbi:LuxR family transcriptional regulator [Telmatospirillum sp. J64-1]|uniref:LuxR family transcriptional regulator n=1 Tax=Telmatospirillum sp. J64-1 TaxID=2502183 RepID=UPI00115E9370|nr:LuxR family transcriptional regulator [Telmatospirillum sp. J64-1]